MGMDITKIDITKIGNVKLKELAIAMNKVDGDENNFSEQEITLFKEGARQLIDDHVITEGDFNKALVEMGLAIELTVPSNQTATQEEKSAETKEFAEDKNDTKAEADNVKTENDSESDKTDKKFDFKVYDSAVNDLNRFVLKDIQVQDPSSPMHSIYNQYVQKIQRAVNEGEDVVSSMYMLDFIEDAVIEISDVKNKYENTQTEEKVYKYGDDKEIKVKQTVNFGGNNSIKDNSSQQEDTTDDGDNDGANTTDNDNKNSLDGGIVYALEAETENGRYVVKADLQTYNQDYYIGGIYNKEFENGNDIAITGIGKATIEQGSSEISGGAALDYRVNKFSTGAYIYGNVDNSTDAGTDVSYKAEGYAKYKDVLQFSVGVDKDLDIVTPSAEIKLYGTKEIKNSGLKLTGSLSGEVGLDDYDDDIYGADMASITSVNFKARGGVAFKADDFSANLDALATYKGSYDNNIKNIYNNGGWVHRFGAMLLGNVRKDNVEVSATICAQKCSGIGTANGEPSISVASTFAIKVHEIMKNITPVISCTIGNNTVGSRAAIQAGFQTNF